MIHYIQTMATWFGTQAHSHGSDTLPLLVSKLSFELTLLAQQVTDQNVLGQMQSAWNHFVQSGQIWALLFGIIIGYFIRGMTGVG